MYTCRSCEINPYDCKTYCYLYVCFNLLLLSVERSWTSRKVFFWNRKYQKRNQTPLAWSPSFQFFFKKKYTIRTTLQKGLWRKLKRRDTVQLVPRTGRNSNKFLWVNYWLLSMSPHYLTLTFIFFPLPLIHYINYNHFLLSFAQVEIIMIDVQLVVASSGYHSSCWCYTKHFLSLWVWLFSSGLFTTRYLLNIIKAKQKKK